jgi:broad specificity phosphatase PhoE
MEPTRALLVRHGQSEWNALGRWQGHADPPLSELGRLQAQHAARAVGAVDAIVSSDLRRASETAAIISAEIGVGPVVTDAALRERDSGEWSGLTRAEIERDWPGYLEPPADEHRSFGPVPARSTPRRPPGWESDESLQARVIDALSRIHELAAGGQVLVITHGGVVYALEGILGASFQRIPNLAGRWFELDGEGPARLGARVLLIDHAEITIPEQL